RRPPAWVRNRRPHALRPRHRDLSAGSQRRGTDRAIARARAARPRPRGVAGATAAGRRRHRPRRRRYPGAGRRPAPLSRPARRPATGRLLGTWSRTRPDAIYIATEGPLGWSALRAALRLGIPVATGFHTRFDAYMRDYRLAWLEPAALRWMRHFHNRADATLVPTRELQRSLQEAGFRQVRLLP